MTKIILIGAVAVGVAGVAVTRFISNRRTRERVTTPASAANDNEIIIDVKAEDVEPAIPRLDDDDS